MSNSNNNQIHNMINEAKSFEDINAINGLVDITDIIMNESLSDQEVLMLLIEGDDDEDDSLEIGEEW